MSRFSFTLKARPTELLKSVNGLEKKRRDWKEESPSFQGFVQELPKIPKDKLKKMKLRKSAQELLPYILVEPDLEPSILNALLLLIESKCVQFSPQSRNRIFAFGLLHSQIRKIAYQYFSEHIPNDAEPRWVGLYWKRIFRPEDPIANLVEIAAEHKVPIVRLLDWFELNPYVQWVDDFWTAYIDKHQPNWLRESSFDDVCAFLRSSAPLPVRSSVLAWVLNSYCQKWEERNEVSAPYWSLMQIAMELWGRPSRGYWKDCTQNVLIVADWVYESSAES